MSTADRLPRLLALVPYLLARPGVLLAEAAADFDVTPAQLRRDLELLWVCGLPGHGPGDLIDLSFEGETVTVTYDAGMSRPLRLNADEALALVVALRTLAEVPGPLGRDAVERALAKIESATGEVDPAAGAVTVHVEPEPAVLAVLQQALADHRAVHLTYYTATRDQSTQRDVDPMRLLLVEGRWYLEAWCRQAEGVRLFRADRIDAARLLDVTSGPPAGAVGRDLSAGLYQPAPEHPLVTLRLTPPARWIADYYTVDQVRELADGGVDVDLRVADTRWLRQLVLRLGGAGQILAPGWLAEQVRFDAEEALKVYQTTQDEAG